jgi:hypothetical protein
MKITGNTVMLLKNMINNKYFLYCIIITKNQKKMNILYRYALAIITISTTTLVLIYNQLLKLIIDLKINNYTTTDFAISIIFGVLIISIYYTIIFKIINNITKYSFFRKRIFKDYHVEGFWLFETYINDEKSSSPFHQIGIGEIRFNNRKKEFETVVTRIKKENNRETEINTNSQSVSINFETLNYINFSELSDSISISNGLAYGKFIKSVGSKIIDSYEGSILQLDTNGLSTSKAFRQKGTRITNSEIANYMKTYGEKWRSNFIRDKEKTLSV